MEIRFHNLYTHFVFTVENRQPVIKEESRERIEKYITGIMNNHECKLYAVYANPDHVHFLVSRSPEISEHRLAELVTEGTETFINANQLCKSWFRWQTTCSAFSVSKKEVDKVCKYILNQPEHHKTESLVEEFDRMTAYYLQSLSDKGIRAR
ncbi:MAG: IS200/IS605 family transposase [Planctomycetaceae bacterium]|nr:IS200/IS605 family transposase [Planctomycetaceae bacterium]